MGCGIYFQENVIIFIKLDKTWVIFVVVYISCCYLRVHLCVCVSVCASHTCRGPWSISVPWNWVRGSCGMSEVGAENKTQVPWKDSTAPHCRAISTAEVYFFFFFILWNSENNWYSNSCYASSQKDLPNLTQEWIRFRLWGSPDLCYSFTYWSLQCKQQEGEPLVQEMCWPRGHLSKSH